MCNKCDWKELVEETDEVLKMLDELPERALDFAISCESTVKGIQDTVLEREHCTEKQRDAVSNIKDGVERWLD